jgi:hypothetical protein
LDTRNNKDAILVDSSDGCENESSTVTTAENAINAVRESEDDFDDELVFLGKKNRIHDIKNPWDQYDGGDDEDSYVASPEKKSVIQTSQEHGDLVLRHSTINEEEKPARAFRTPASRRKALSALQLAFQSVYDETSSDADDDDDFSAVLYWSITQSKASRFFGPICSTQAINFYNSCSGA